jgi:phenylpyruvate tautomerase PptA (4-oxalocrotonate tautomerase family)
VPYLQFDVPNHYPVEVKRSLARRLGKKYARFMQTTPDMVTVTFRELGEGGVWRCRAGEPEPAAVLSCDIRRGRPPKQRAELAEATWYEILQHFTGQPYPPVYRAFGKLRPKLGRRVDLVPAFPYTFADTEFVQGDGRPE